MFVTIFELSSVFLKLFKTNFWEKFICFNTFYSSGEWPQNLFEIFLKIFALWWHGETITATLLTSLLALINYIFKLNHPLYLPISLHPHLICQIPQHLHFFYRIKNRIHFIVYPLISKCQNLSKMLPPIIPPKVNFFRVSN